MKTHLVNASGTRSRCRYSSRSSRRVKVFTLPQFMATKQSARCVECSKIAARIAASDLNEQIGDPSAPVRPCSVSGCIERHYGRGFCRRHYRMWRCRVRAVPAGSLTKTGESRVTDGKDPLANRFWRRVKKTDDCWLWVGTGLRNGYGRMIRDGKPLLAHRAAYEIQIGPIPDGMLVCHRCDNRRCVRGDHLFLGTNADNNRDCINKGRRTDLGERNTHAKLTDESVRAMRAMRKAGAAILQLATRFNISTTGAHRVCIKRSWKHV